MPANHHHFHRRMVDTQSRKVRERSRPFHRTFREWGTGHMAKALTKRLATSLALLLGAALSAHAADAPKHGFDPLQTFAPFTYPQAANAMRDASGKPGPAFWQNHADYRIEATLDPSTRKLSGSEVISYTNRSPDALPVLWLQIEQNRYRKDARGAFGGAKFPTEFTSGEHIRSVEVEDAGGRKQKAHWVVSDTRMQVTLPTALKGHGGQLKLHIAWDTPCPASSAGAPTSTRTGKATSSRWRSGIRAWPSTTTCAAGTPSPTSTASSTSNTATSTIASPCLRTCWWSARANCSTRRTC